MDPAPTDTLLGLYERLGPEGLQRLAAANAALLQEGGSAAAQRQSPRSRRARSRRGVRTLRMRARK